MSSSSTSSSSIVVVVVVLVVVVAVVVVVVESSNSAVVAADSVVATSVGEARIQELIVCTANIRNLLASAAHLDYPRPCRPLIILNLPPLSA